MLVFAPELLPSSSLGPDGPVYMEYAQLHRTAAGDIDESCDRWQQAIVLARIARIVFNAVASDHDGFCGGSVPTQRPLD